MGDQSGTGLKFHKFLQLYDYIGINYNKTVI